MTNKPSNPTDPSEELRLNAAELIAKIFNSHIKPISRTQALDELMALIASYSREAELKGRVYGFSQILHYEGVPLPVKAKIKDRINRIKNLSEVDE